MQQCHELVTNAKESNAELAPPVEVARNRNNVAEAEKAILNAYSHDTLKLPYRTIKASPHWGFMHDGISKFGKKFDGFYIHGSDEIYDPINVPYHLSKMKGGVSGFDLGLYLFFKLSG